MKNAFSFLNSQIGKIHTVKVDSTRYKHHFTANFKLSHLTRIFFSSSEGTDSTMQYTLLSLDIAQVFMICTILTLCSDFLAMFFFVGSETTVSLVVKLKKLSELFVHVCAMEYFLFPMTRKVIFITFNIPLFKSRFDTYPNLKHTRVPPKPLK